MFRFFEKKRKTLNIRERRKNTIHQMLIICLNWKKRGQERKKCVKLIIFNWNHFEMRLLNLRINFYLLRTFCRHLGSFCVVPSFTMFQPNFTAELLQGILPQPRIGMMSLVTVSPVITAFHSCCLSHHVFT